MNVLKRHGEKIALGALLLLAGFLSLFNIQSQGYSNEFYAACVKSMTLSFKNFFFVALDPGGWVTVDKPPVSLWVQAIFAKVFGFHTWSFLLPESLAAVASVWIIYRVVKRHFGGAASLVSGLALALSPIFIVVSKTNNTDSVLILFMTLAAWAMAVAADKGRLRYLILSAVLLGVAYNAKTLEAFLILPALFCVYLFGTSLKWRTRALHLAVAAVVLAAVSLSWSLAVDLTPASERPYVDNSTTNSELELAIGYNGIQRITGQNRGGSGARFSFTGDSSDAGAKAAEGGTPALMPGGMQNGTTSGGTASKSAGSSSENSSDSTGNPFNIGGFGGLMNGGGGMGNSFSGGGSASPLRMFNTTLGGQDSWLLPFGLFAMLALLLRCIRAREKEQRKKLLRNLLLWGVSVITMIGYFSVANFFHPYYLSALCPFLAALVGIGLVEMWKLYKEEKFFGFLLPLAFLATLAVQIAMLRSYPAYAHVLSPLIAVLTGVPALALAVMKPLRKGTDKSGAALAGVALAGLLIAPAVWLGYSVFTNSFNAQIPAAGPAATETFFGGSRGFGQGMRGGNFEGGFGGMYGRFGQSDFTGGRSGGTSGNSESGGDFEGGFDARSFERGGNMSGKPGSGGSFGGEGSDTALIQFLLRNNTGEKWLAAVPDASEAEPIILSTSKPVIAVGGFSGNDNTLTVAKLEELVKSGQLKYFLAGGSGGRGGASSEVTAWVEKYGKAVDSSKWSGSSSSSGSGTSGRMESSGTLYDLSGYKASSSSAK